MERQPQDVITPDVRRTLPMIYDEWVSCQACELGVHRHTVGGQFVFGEGKPGGLMFVGEGPGKTEEQEGKPFVGDSGQLLRKVIEGLNLEDYYITNTVLCRSCRLDTDEAGNPKMTRAFKGGPMIPRYVDIPPSKKQVEACSRRLYEEIYVVDPVIIIALGAGAASALAGRAVSITKDRGLVSEIEIPGATWVPKIGAKGWVRKAKGELSLPVEQNQVKYLMMPTLHPAYVLRKQTDSSTDGRLAQFINDIKHAVSIYYQYRLETQGVLPEELTYEANEEILEGLDEESSSG